MYCSAELQAVPVGGNEKESILEQVACSYAAMVQSVRGMKPLTASSNLKRLGWFAAVNVGIMLTLLPIIAPGVFIIPIIGIASAFISLALSSFLAKRSHGVIILDPKENLSEEEFNKLRTNFNIPSLGKLACPFDRYKALKDRYKYINKIRNDTNNKEDKANV